MMSDVSASNSIALSADSDSNTPGTRFPDFTASWARRCASAIPAAWQATTSSRIRLLVSSVIDPRGIVQFTCSTKMPYQRVRQSQFTILNKEVPAKPAPRRLGGCHNHQQSRRDLDCVDLRIGYDRS